MEADSVYLYTHTHTHTHSARAVGEKRALAHGVGVRVHCVSRGHVYRANPGTYAHTLVPVEREVDCEPCCEPCTDCASVRYEPHGA
jgi:hypothetical protein